MFKVGQKIVCIDNYPRDNRPESIQILSKLKIDEVYTVKEILDVDGKAISLIEIITPYSEKRKNEMGFKSDRFRPLDSYQFAEDVLNKISEEIEEEIFVRI